MRKIKKLELHQQELIEWIVLLQGEIEVLRGENERLYDRQIRLEAQGDYLKARLSHLIKDTPDYKREA